MEGTIHEDLTGGKTLIESIFFYTAFEFYVASPTSSMVGPTVWQQE